MKKSSFLRNSKEMLTRSFNPAKCKTSLKLASSRLKLLRNKKQAQVKQMKRELAQLLESGQDQTARIRVEHVVREEKMMAAYDLIEIYCELIVARLPIIESQKNCPIDLKEAITSVVFASPRCGDIPELVDVRKHLTAKYGKEFISAAVELRPDCGVGRMLVEKLSAKAPDGQTKIKILGAIAEEHGVKWDPKTFGELESVPPNDLLNGPNSIGKANNIREEPTHFEASDVRTPLDHGMSPNARSYYSEQNARASLGNQHVVSAHGSGRGTAPSSNYHPGGSPSGFRDERSEVDQSFPGDGNFSVGRQNRNMEFKDATSAAQAAAESAERASLAARAAAELAGVKYSSESERSVVHSSGGAGPGTHGTSTSIHEHFPNDSATSTVPDRNPQFQNERIDGSGHDNLSRAARHNYTRDTSDRPQSQASSRTTGSINNDSFASLQDGDKYRQKSLSKEGSRGKLSMKKPSGKADVESMSSFEKDSPVENNDYYEEEKPRKEPKINSSGKMSMKKPSGKTEVEYMSSFEKDFPTENFNYFGEEKTREEPKINSSDSYSSTSRFGADIPHSSHQSFGYDMTDDPFNGDHQDHVPCETAKTNSHDSSPLAFDDSGSDDDDDIKFDTDPVYEDQQAKLYFPSPERKYKDSWSFDTDKSAEKSPLPSEIFVERHSPPQLSENLAASGNNSQPEIVVPAFDDSDGMNSESDSDMVSPRIGRSKDIQNVTHEHGQRHDVPESSFMKKNSGTDRKQWELSSSDKTTSFSSAKDKAKHTISQNAKDSIGAPVFTGTQTDDDNLASSVSEFEKEFKFGKITGGLKHKGYIRPPYARSQLNYVPSSVEKAEESPVAASQVASPTSPVGLGMRMKRDDKSSSRVKDTHSASDTDSSEEESLPETLSFGQRTFAQKAGNNRKDAGLRGSTTYFDSDSSDSEVDSKKESLAGRSQLGGGFSRRTKASSTSLDTSSSSKFKIRSEAPSKFDFGVDRKTTRNSFDAETQEPQKPVRNFYVADAQEQQRPTRNFYVADAQEPQRPTRNFYVADAQEPQRPTRNFYVADTQETPTFKKMSPEQNVAEISSSKPVAQPKNTSQESWNSGKVERPSSSAHTEAASSSNDTPKASASSGRGFSRDDSMKKASHVHPKLPDYDDIAAKLQSLRMNRK